MVLNLYNILMKSVRNLRRSPEFPHLQQSGKEVVVPEHPLSRGFGSFASFEVLVVVLVNSQPKHRGPDLVEHDMFSTIVNHSLDSLIHT